jgi:hypothetical protein
VSPVILVQSWRKLVPDLEDDYLQGLPNKEISRSETSMVCATKSSENINKDNDE